MLLHLLIVATSPFIIATYAQNSLFPVDGFVFDGPATGGKSPDGQQRTTITTESTSASTTTPRPEDQFNTCVSSCPTTPEYNPVCGTDNVDYTNPGNLGCAERCGKEVTINYYGRCSTSRTG